MNGVAAGGPGYRADEPSGWGGHRSEIFLESAAPYGRRYSWLKPSDCRLFGIDPRALKAGVSRVVRHNEGSDDLEIERLNLPL